MPAYSPAEIHTLSAMHPTSAILLLHGRMILETRAAVESQQGLAVLQGGWVVESATGIGAELMIRRGLTTEVVRIQPDGRWLFVIDNPHPPE